MRMCIFCGQRADSKEDLFPQWLDRDFRQPKGTAMPITTRVGDSTAVRPNWKIAFLKVRCVCRECNNGWMSELENKVKSLVVQFLEGADLRLQPSEQLDLSLWVTMKAMVFEVAAHYQGVITQQERTLLMEQQRTPANVRVVLASLDEGNHFMVRRKFVAGWRKRDSKDLEYAYATTFLLGHFVAQVVGSPTSKHHAFEQHALVRPDWQTITPPVVPHANWPTQERLSEDELEHFADTFVPNPDEELDPSTFPGAQPPRPPGRRPLFV
jgi:hypothetical protein